MPAGQILDLGSDVRRHRHLPNIFQELSGGTFRIRIDDVLANDHRVIVLVTESARRGNRDWSSPQVHAWTIENGKASVFWQFQGDQQTEDEFWS